MIRRRYEPYKGNLAIPGGRVESEDYGKTPVMSGRGLERAFRRAAKREAKEKVGVDVRIFRKIGVYDTPGRDPRGNYVTNVYYARLAGGCTIKDIKAGDDAEEVHLFKAIPNRMAFDHEKILTDSKLFGAYWTWGLLSI